MKILKLLPWLLVVPTALADVPLFTKISGRGLALPDDAALGNGPNEWACTRDNRTGLTWEVKTGSGMRAGQHNYTWRIGNSGVFGNTSSCGNTLSGLPCNVGNYVSRVNGVRLCGATDWRVPGGTYVAGPAANSPGELAVLYRNLLATPGVVPGAWLPNTRLFWNWTARTYAGQLSSSWLVNFGTGQVFYNYWDLLYPLIAVSDTVRSDDVFRNGFGRGWEEHFVDMTLLPLRGWRLGNRSDPRGTTNWFQGSADVFPAQAGSTESYVAANFNNASGQGTISNWLATPALTFSPSARFSFWTRQPSASTYADRLEVRLCTGGSCDLPASGAGATGNFSVVLLDINPALVPGDDPSGAAGYPHSWTRFELDTADGLPSSGSGRIAFRYFVTQGGPDGSHSDYVGIDSVRYRY